MTDACYFARSAQPLKKPDTCEACICSGACKMFANFIRLREVRDRMIIRVCFKYREIPIDIEMDSLDEDLDVLQMKGLLDKATEFVNKVLDS